MCADEQEKMTWGRGSCLSSYFKRVSAENNEVDVRKKTNKQTANHLMEEVARPRMQHFGRSFILVTRVLWGCYRSSYFFVVVFFLKKKKDRLCAYVADAGFRFQMGLCSRTPLVWPHGGYLKNWFAASQHEDQILDNTGNCLATSAAAQHAVYPLSRAPSALNSCVHVQKN